MTYKVIQWATGYIGEYSLKYILNNPNLELVGLKCFSDSKEGVDAGTIAGMAPMGVKATQDTTKLLELDADCVVYMPQDRDLVDPYVEGSHSQEIFKALIPILESGKNVVTSVTTQIAPQFAGPEGVKCVEELERACQKGKSTFFGTGVEPGFFNDAMALCLASVCAEVNSIRGYQYIDFGHFDQLKPLQAMGLCVWPEELAARESNSLEAIYRSDPYYLAQGIGAKLDDLRLGVEFATAPETYVTDQGLTIEKGMVAALRFSVEGLVNGDPVVAIQHVTRMGQHIAPHWPNIPPLGGYRIEIEGSTPISADFPIGTGYGSAYADASAMTSARAVNAVEFVCKATPGFKTFFDLPMITGTHSFRYKGSA